MLTLRPQMATEVISELSFRPDHRIVSVVAALSRERLLELGCGSGWMAEMLAQAGYAVVGISPDAPAKLEMFRDGHALSYPLLSDVGKDVLTAYGAYGEKSLYGKTVTGVIRSTFVIDADGRISGAFYNVKATGHVAKLRRDLGIS